MRVVLASAFFLSASAIGFACGGSTSSGNNPAPDGGATGNDAGTHQDAQPQGEGGTGIDISGSKAIKITVQKYTGTAVPFDGVRARIETLGNTGHQDVKTAPDGTATFNVDPAKGPFDITIADSGSTAVSILGVTDSVPGNIVIYPLGTSTAFSNIALTGAVTGAAAANRLQIDAWDYVTTVTTPGAVTYSSKYAYSAAVKIKIGMAAIEVDPQGNAVKGLLTPLQDRTGQPMKFDIDMATATAPTVSTINIKWPTTGLLTGTTIKGIDKTVNDNHIGTGIIEKLRASEELGAAMFVGIGDVALPANGVSAFKLQVFGGDMAPDVAGARLTTLAAGKQATAADVGVLVQAHDLTNGATLEVTAVNKFEVKGATLGDLTFAADTAGYDDVEVDIADAKAGVVWKCISLGPMLASRGLPSLPTGVAVAELAGADITPLVSLVSTKYVPNAHKSWESLTTEVVYATYNVGGLGVTTDGR
jgi:hypothetical protein